MRSPRTGGLVSSFPMTEKRSRAHRCALLPDSSLDMSAPFLRPGLSSVESARWAAKSLYMRFLLRPTGRLLRDIDRPSPCLRIQIPRSQKRSARLEACLWLIVLSQELLHKSSR